MEQNNKYNTQNIMLQNYTPVRKGNFKDIIKKKKFWEELTAKPPST